MNIRKNTIGFEATGSYAPSLPLVMDPTIGFSSFLGGSGDDTAYGVAVDAAGGQVATTNPLGATTTMVLNANGAAVATIDANGNVTVTILNAAGETVGSVDALGNVTQTILDADGGVRTVIDSDGNETDYVLDADGRVAETITPLGTTTTTYNAVGLATSTTDADGRTINYSYDADNRLTGEVWLNSSAVTVNILTFTYDYDGNMLTAANSTGTETYTYDAQDRVQSYTDVWGLTLTYTYNGNDQVTQRTDSLGGTLTYVYDNASRLTSEQFSGTGATGTVVRVDFGYDAANEQTGITWYSNLAGTSEVAHSTSTFDAAGNVTSIVNTNSSSTTLSAYTYTYDPGNRVTSQEHWSKVGTVVYSGTNSYSYDATNQLLSDGTSTYSYDSNGNRTMAGYATGTDNETTSDGTYTYTYDAVGNLIEKSAGHGEQTWYYAYDNENNQISVRETSDGTTNIAWNTYTYDAQGMRVAEQDWTSGGGSTTTRFALDGDNVWMDLDGSNTPLVRYLYGVGANQILTRTVGSGANAGPWVYLTDNLGSVRDLVDWSGAVQDHLDYTGYGVVTESNPSVGSRYQYAGYQTDVLTGTDFTIARVYNPATGNWQSQDPLQFQAGDSNLSRYVGNDPVDSVDPSGLAGFTMPNGPYQSQYAPAPGYNVALDILQTDPDDRTLSESWQMFTNRRGLIRMARQLAAKYDYGYKGMRPQAGPPGASAPAQTGPAPQNGGGGMTTNFFEAIPNNGNGGDLLQEVEQIMTSGRPVAAGSLPIYGDGTQNAAQAGGSAGRMIVQVGAWELTAIGTVTAPGAGIASAGAVGTFLALGEYGNAVFAGIPFILKGVGKAAGWAWNRIFGISTAGRATITLEQIPGQVQPHVTIATEYQGTVIHTEQIIFPNHTTTISQVHRAQTITREGVVALPNAQAAQAYQQSVIGANGGIYNAATNSCITHVANVLNAGGLSIITSTRAAINSIRRLLGW